MIDQYAAFQALVDAVNRHEDTKKTAPHLQAWREKELPLRATVIAAAKLVAELFTANETRPETQVPPECLT